MAFGLPFGSPARPVPLFRAQFGRGLPKPRPKKARRLDELAGSTRSAPLRPSRMRNASIMRNWTRRREARAPVRGDDAGASARRRDGLGCTLEA